MLLLVDSVAKLVGRLEFESLKDDDESLKDDDESLNSVSLSLAS
jgi:hypothetical protein